MYQSFGASESGRLESLPFAFSATLLADFQRNSERVEKKLDYYRCVMNATLR